MIAPQLNSAVLAHLRSKGFTSTEIMPLLGYSDTRPPFILWSEYDAPLPRDSVMIKTSTVVYYIYDTKVKTLGQIAYHIERYLSPEFNAQAINADITMADANYRILSITPSGGGMFPPLEREGFASKSVIFEVRYTYANQSE